MAVSEMNFISIIGDMENIDEIVNICGESGVFQPDNVFSFYSNTEGFAAISAENPYLESFQTLKNAVHMCGKKPFKVDIKKFFTSPMKIERYVKFFSKTINERLDKKRQLYKQISQEKQEIEVLKNFYGLNKTVSELLDCEYVIPKFGKIPVSTYGKFASLRDESAKKDIELLFFPFKNDGEYQWGIYFSDSEHRQEIDRLFSSLYFEEVELKPYDMAPYEQVMYFENHCQELYKQIEILEKEISEFWDSQKNKCMKFYLKLRQLSTYFEIKSYAARYNSSFILVGWVPKEHLKDLQDKISKVKGIEYTTEEGKNILDHLPPVKLKNKKLFKPFEFFVDTYGMPSYNEIDPTAFVAITYTILFGIMFADLGQGLVVSLAGYLMWKFKNMKLGKALIPCGISSAIFGILFGSVFGFEHVLDTFYQKVFGLPGKPIEIMESNTTSYVIYATIGIGILLLIISMIMGVYSSLKRKNLGEALFSSNGLSGLVLYSSIIFVLLDMIVLHTGVVNTAFIIAFIGIPLIVLMFSEILVKLVNKQPNWKPESWVDYILQGFFELFEMILSYGSNTISFLRVGAFALVHVGMMMAVFTIAEMVGSGIGYYIVVILGNAIVIVLEALLSGIQVLRLEFYEIFSKFFEGQGRAFTPISVSDNLN